MAFLKSMIGIGDWPQIKIIQNGLYSWVPVKPQITRQRLLTDMAEEVQLKIVRETDTRIVFRHRIYEWTISFMKNQNSGISYCEVGPFEYDKQMWLGRNLDSRGILDDYFDKKYIRLMDMPQLIDNPDAMQLAKLCAHFAVELVDKTNRIKELESDLKLIMSYAGNPDASEGCRIIIKRAKQVLGEE